MIILREYQVVIVKKIIDFFKRAGRSAIITAPTGAGKTVIFSYICHMANKKNNKVLILTDRAELLLQTGGTIKSFGINPFYIEAGVNYIERNHSTYVAMAQSLRNRIDKPIWLKWFHSIDLFIIDEAHKQEFNYLFKKGLLKNKRVLGFTATPKRSGAMRQLAQDYEEIIESISVSELINLGYLVADDYFGLHSPDLSEIKYNKLKGDFDEREMYNSYNVPKLYAGVVKNWKEHCNNTQTLVFCVNIQHAIKTTLEFRSMGINARFIVSNVSKPKEPQSDKPGMIALYKEKLNDYRIYRKYFSMYSGERSFIFNKFKNKEFTVLINVGIAISGYDNPSIETIVVNRATLSVTLWLQMIGRGSRINNGKTHFNLLDFGDNASRLGHYTTPYNWDLWHEPKKTKNPPRLKKCGINSKGQPVIKDVPGCKKEILASLKICIFCGFKYPKKSPKEIDLKLLMYDGIHTTKISNKKINDLTDDELYVYYKAKKHKQAWLWRQLYFRGGEERIKEFGILHKWKEQTINEAINYNQISK